METITLYTKNYRTLGSLSTVFTI